MTTSCRSRSNDCPGNPVLRTITADSASQPSVTFDRVATSPGSLIVLADGTVAGCTLDDEREGCSGRDERHDGGTVRCIKWCASGCDYCGVH